MLYRIAHSNPPLAVALVASADRVEREADSESALARAGAREMLLHLRNDLRIGKFISGLDVDNALLGGQR